MNRIINGLLLFMLGIYVAPGMADNQSASLAYVTNPFNNTVSMCQINDEHGGLEDCKDSGTLNSSWPYDIAFNVLNEKTHAYLANLGSVTQCAVDDDGSLSTVCFPLENTPSEQFGIAFHANKNNVQYAYVSTGVNFDPVYKCHIHTERGMLETCHDATPVFPQAAQYIIFESFKNGTYAYITTGDGISQCTVTENGDLNCIHSLVDGGAVDVAFAEINEEIYAYITQPFTLRVSKCSVSDEGVLDLDSCSKTGNDIFVSPRAIEFYEAKEGLHAYVTDNAVFGVWKCNVDSRMGALRSCALTGSGFVAPHGITLQ